MKVRAIVIEGEADPALVAQISAAIAGIVDGGAALQIETLPVTPIAAILSRVGFEMGLVPAEIRGDCRAARLFRARQAVAWIARKAIGASSAKIGREMGDRDHSTVLHQLTCADALRLRDPAFRALTDRLVAEFAA